MYDELQRHNRRATWVLLITAVLVVALMVWLLVGWIAPELALDPVGGLGVTAFGTTLGIGATYLSYRAGPSIALRAARARLADPHQFAELHNVFDEVCVSAGILDRKPRLYVIDDPAPNAFATGRSPDDAHIAVTTGLMHRLPRYELRAVLAHEVGHVINRDLRAVTIAVATAGIVALLADVLARALWYGGRARSRGRGGGQQGGGAAAIFALVGIIAIILAPIAAQLIRFAVSRQREYLADATAADILRDPQSMVNALRRIDHDHGVVRNVTTATAHLWFEEPNELEGKSSAAKLARRFATHPTIRQRIERLASLHGGTVDIEGPLPPGPLQSPDNPPS